jgi:hypothetical protein
MFEVPNQFAQDPGLIWVRDTGVHSMLHSERENLRPRQMMQLDLLELAPIDFDWVHAGRRRDLVGERHDRIERLLAGDIEVRLDLSTLEIGVPRLDLHESGPGTTSTCCLQNAVRDDGAIVEHEGDFDKRRQLPPRRSEWPRDRRAELADRAHHRQQGGGRSSLCLVLSVDPAGRNQPRRLPGVLRHTPPLREFAAGSIVASGCDVVGAPEVGGGAPAIAGTQPALRMSTRFVRNSRTNSRCGGRRSFLRTLVDEMTGPALSRARLRSGRGASARPAPRRWAAVRRNPTRARWLR